MKVISVQKDLRSSCTSVLVEMSLAEYKELAYEAFVSNGNLDGQRGVIKKSSAALKIRKRMILDFNQGAIFPQVVLGALNIDDALFEENKEIEVKELNIPSISIIDGMQRSNIYFENFENNKDRIIRVEFWVADELIKLLYRMLVLNTGQMPWNTRRQVEVLYMALSESIKEKLFSKYRELDGKIQILGIDDAKKRSQAGIYHKANIIETYLAFNVRTVKVQVLDTLAEEFQRFDMMEAIEKPKSFEYFIDVLAMLFKLDLAFSTNMDKSGTGDDWGQFKSGKDIFSSVPACVGFIVACAEFILGKISVNRSESDIEHKRDELLQKITLIINKIEESAEDTDYLKLGTLNSISEDLPRTRIGDEQRLFFKDVFTSMIKYDDFNEIENLEAFWRE